MNGADYIAEFLYRRCSNKVFLITGGACAFMVDAVARHPKLKYYCFQHEQSAAMAADAIWRLSKKVGVTMATSGPGATNLITGIACSYFDSIPTMHITGQVNMNESRSYLGAKVRQAGFQETNIVDMVRPITKYAVQVGSAEELPVELAKGFEIATSGRMGPVLIDVPMNVQQEEVGEYKDEGTAAEEPLVADPDALKELVGFLKDSQRPLVLFGAGIGLAGVETQVLDWIQSSGLSFVASWNALSYFNHSHPNYLGAIGVYGNRGANFVLQNCDKLLVLGSRLDNRQRSGNPKTFVPGGKIHVVDVDAEELKKYKGDGYGTTHMNLRDFPAQAARIELPGRNSAWLSYQKDMKTKFFDKDISTYAAAHYSISPYDAVQRINRMIADDAIVVSDCGANLCWVYQIFKKTNQHLFTAGGNSPMGYALPAAIGAKLEMPDKQVVCFIGDGGLQVNLQDLQTIAHYGLNIAIIILNNKGYGIIKQFQDSYLGHRYEASGNGYSIPDFEAVAGAFGIKYHAIESVSQLQPGLINQRNPAIVDILLDPNTLIEPKLEMGRPINDQFPYLDDAEFKALNRFVGFTRR